MCIYILYSYRPCQNSSFYNLEKELLIKYPPEKASKLTKQNKNKLLAFGIICVQYNLNRNLLREKIVRPTQ